MLFFRLGDFYEMFAEDALEASKLLGLTLTQRNGVPMCGIPYHSSQNYTHRLLRAGKKIAVCEQVKLPEGGKGLAERQVVEILTPATILEAGMLDSGVNNFLLSCFADKELVLAGAGVLYSAALDISTGELFLSRQRVGFERLQDVLRDEVSAWDAREIILQEGLVEKLPDLAGAEAGAFAGAVSGASYSTAGTGSGGGSAVGATGDVGNAPSAGTGSGGLLAARGTIVNRYPDWVFSGAQAFDKLVELLKVTSLKSFGIEGPTDSLAPVGPILEYAGRNTGKRPDFICRIALLQSDKSLKIDENSIRNLELFENLREGGTRYSLFGVLARTRTGMGTRLLRQRLTRPLTSVSAIDERLDRAFEIADARNDMATIRKVLAGIADIERLCARVSMEKAHARDIQSLAASCLEIVGLAGKLVSPLLRARYADLLATSALDLAREAADAIAENPSVLLTEGRIFATGYNAELDRLRGLKEDSRAILSKLLETEREKSGIQNLKIRYNRIIGYHFEVSRGQTTKVPEHFIRRQSLVNAERFTTEELGALELEINDAADKVVELERNLFVALRERFRQEVDNLMACAARIADLDCALAAAELAVEEGWTRPVLVDDPVIEIRDGRHPVVAAASPRGSFIPNDLDLSATDNGTACALITGPNMAGKSTYLRQNALIVILAQMGFPVPAGSATIGICDQVFCRVGASDNLARGESTFLVEMSETALILRTATRRSFLILDEVGRGTSTQDGLAIAQAVLEHLTSLLGARTLFATHYHELTDLGLQGLKNLCLSVREDGDRVTFLRKVVEGASDSSYGIHVAQIAGVPRSVIERAFEVLRERANPAGAVPGTPRPGSAADKESPSGARAPAAGSTKSAPSLFDAPDEILLDLGNIDPSVITPLQALVYISRWKELLESKSGKNL